MPRSIPKICEYENFLSFVLLVRSLIFTQYTISFVCVSGNMTCTFRLVNTDLLTSFLNSLQGAILQKHEGSKLALNDTFDLEIKESFSEEIGKYNLESEPKLAASFGFQVQLYKEEKGHTAGLLGYCKANFDSPDSHEDHKWGRIDISLVTLRANTADLNKNLRQRKIHIGLNSSYLRRVMSDGSRSMWIKGQYGFQVSHWHSEGDFQKIVKIRVEDSKKIQLATGKDKMAMMAKPLYCGDPNAAVYIKRDSGDWEEKRNEEVVMHDDEDNAVDNPGYKNESDENSQLATTAETDPNVKRPVVTQPEIIQHYKPSVSTSADLMQPPSSAAAAMFSFPPPSIGLSCDEAGQNFYPQDDEDYNGATARLRVHDPPHGGQHAPRHSATELHGNWGRQEVSTWSPGGNQYKKPELPRSDGRHSHHWKPRDGLQDTYGQDSQDHYYHRVDYNRIQGAPQNSPLGAIRKRTNDVGPATHGDPNIEQQLDRESLLDNVKKNLSGVFAASRPKPLFAQNQLVNDISQRFPDAVRLDVQSQWKKNMRRNRSPSPGPAGSPFLQAGIPGLPVRSSDFSAGTLADRGPVLPSGQLLYQENLRQQIQSKMSNLSSCQEKLTNVLQEEGYKVSDDDFEAELYSNKNITASTDPSLLAADYGQRIKIMIDVNRKLTDQLRIKKEKLQMLIGNAKTRRSLRLKQQGQKGRNKNDDYHYY